METWQPLAANTPGVSQVLFLSSNLFCMDPAWVPTASITFSVVQLFCNQVPFRDMFQCYIDIKLPGNTQSGKKVICLVGVGLQRDFFAEHRQHGLEFYIEGGTVCNMISGTSQFCLIFPGPERTSRRRAAVVMRLEFPFSL